MSKGIFMRVLLALFLISYSSFLVGQEEIDSGSTSVIELLSRTELHRWERHIRGFRREHNFALSAGVSSGEWNVARFGSIRDKTYENTGVFSRFQYSFHLQLYQGFGYLLGSSAGYHYETADRRSEFRPVAAVQYPGVVVGLVYNLNPVLRFSTAFEAYLERHSGIQENDKEGENNEIHVTVQAYDAGIFIDVFYDLGWAIRLEAHNREVYYKRPFKSEDFAVDAKITKKDQWLGLGLVYHLL